MITSKVFDNYQGKQLHVYTLTDGISVDICTLGATILAIRVPDKFGNTVDVALGKTTAHTLLSQGDYMGSVVGRCGNRINYGEFTLEGVSYKLAQNNGTAHLHGGNVGFNSKVYDATVENNTLVLTMTSPDGDENYPGELHLTVKYTVKGSALQIDYFATTNKTTLCNPTNHAYFNLNGESDGSILDNFVQLFADKFMPVDEHLIPTAIADVAGTPFDFRQGKTIGQDIDGNHSQLVVGAGYDHNFCLNGNHCATAKSAKTGIVMDVFTDLPGVQFYSGNFLVGNVGKSVYNKRSGFCLETQHFPDAINRTDCKQPILKAGEQFVSTTTYAFSVEK